MQYAHISVNKIKPHQKCILCLSMTKISNSGLRICSNFYERIFKMLQISKKLLKDKRHFIFHASFIIVDFLLILNTIKTKETKNFNLCQMKTLCSCHGYSKIIGNTKNINSQQHLNLRKKGFRFSLLLHK